MRPSSSRPTSPMDTDDTPGGSEAHIRQSAQEAPDAEEDAHVPGLLGRLFSFLGRTGAGGGAPSSSSSDSDTSSRGGAPQESGGLPPVSGLAGSARGGSSGEDDAAAAGLPAAAGPPALQPPSALDSALSGLHLDPAAKPGAGLAEGDGAAGAATPQLPKPVPGVPATAPPALAGGRLTRRAAAAAAAASTSTSQQPSSSGSEAGEAGAAPAPAGAAPAPAVAASAASSAAVQPPPPAAPPKLTRAAAAAAAAGVAPGTPVATTTTTTTAATAAAAPLPPPRAPPTAHRTSGPPAQPSPGDLAVGLVYDPAMEAHTPPGAHVERPARLSVLAGLLAARGLTRRCWPLTPVSASDEDLLRMHSADHVKAVDGGYEAALADGLGLERGDMFYSPGTARAARLAAGSVTTATLAVLSGEVRRGFAVVRPPGHHATCARSMGFCFFNNVAVAAAAARAVGGAERVLIVDWDVHHGNGVADLVDAANASDAAAGRPPGLMYASLHRGAGFYPGTGAPVEVGPPGAKGTTLNVAWGRGGMGDADYAAAFELVLMPAARAFDPSIVLIAAGFDAAAGDPLGGCVVSPAGFAYMASRLCTLAGGRVVAALEGGYNTGATAAAAAAVVEVLLQGGAPGGDEGGVDAPGPPGRPSREAAPAIEAAAKALAPHCPVLRPLVGGGGDGGGGGGGGEGGFSKAWAAYSSAAQAPRRTRAAAAAVA